MMRTVVFGVLGLAVLVLFSAGAQPGVREAEASSPGTTNAPLLSCPNFGADGEVDLFNDVFAVVDLYGLGPGDPGYHPLYDVAPPVQAPGAPIDLFEDIFGIAGRFGDVCPAVDVEVALATVWGIENLPVDQDDAALEALGYYRSTTDVPGQGIHYVKLELWDENFDPAQPEGLVYHGGKLAAQLYITNGDDVGWGDHEATSFPPPSVPHNIDLEDDPEGPQCVPACSWAGAYDGWHLHYFLCTIGVGTAGAAALPGSIFNIQDEQDCVDASGGQPECTVPVTTQPCYRFSVNVGWMGHLWNHQLNPNVLPDEGGDNGRFADCFPDTQGWKAFNCPA